MSDPSELARAATELLKTAPKLYDDGARPIVKELGKAGKTVGQTINTILAPLALSVFAYNQAKPVIEQKIAAKIKNVSSEKIIKPQARVVIPALQSFVHAVDGDEVDEEISDMFANLIASAVNVDSATNVHPSFTEIINNITSDEAKVLRTFYDHNPAPLINYKYHLPIGGFHIALSNFSQIGVVAKCARQDLVPAYLDNLCRLGILEIPSDQHLNDPLAYKDLEEHPEIVRLKNEIGNQGEGHRGEIEKKIVRLTAYGSQFIKVCLSKTSPLKGSNPTGKVRL